MLIGFLLILWIAFPLLTALLTLVNNAEGSITFVVFMTYGLAVVAYQAILSGLVWFTAKNKEVPRWLVTFGTGFLAVFPALFAYGILFGFPTGVPVPLNFFGPAPTDADIINSTGATSMNGLS